MLARTCFSNNTGFSHAAGQNNLTQNIINLMCPSMVQLITFKIHFRATQVFGQTLRVIKGARPPNVIGPQVLHLSPKTIISFCKLILRFKI